MRFKADGPAIPDVLLDERDAGNVVFLCGAGVSIEAGMPNFEKLARHVVGELDPPQDSEIRRALQTYDADEDSTPVGWRQRSLDEVFQMLYDDYRPEQVAESVWRKLSKTREAQPHHTIARLSANTEGYPQIVTTNFDHLFETAIGKEAPRFEAPAFPDLRRSPKGITYLHGRLADSESGPHNYILSSSDLGRAYLAEGWATGFVRELLQRYTVVLLGYQAEDPPLRYLLQGLDSAGKPSWDRLFAFDKGDDEHVRAKWSGRNVRAIPYNGNKHDALWETLEAWAERADNPAAWRNAVVERSGNGQPWALEPHERGMIAHVVKTATGAKQFADQDPVPSAEWLCVFDASYRYARPKSGIGSSLQPSDPLLHPFDPLETYGLDDDPPRPSGTVRDGGPQGEDLISWRPGDESADRWQGLSRRRGRQPAPLPPRLHHLARWLVSCVSDPVLAWWVARQPALHPRLHQMLKSAVEGSPGLTDDARRGWVVLLEALESRAPHPVDVDLHHLPKRIGKHGWRAGLIREFEALTEPVFEAGPPRTLREPQPPSGDWSDVKWPTVADIRIRFPSQTVSWPAIPDDNLPSVYAALERNLLRVCARTREASEIGWEGADVRPDSRDRNAYVSLFRETLDRLARRDADRVKQHIALWPDPDPHIFDRLRLSVWSNSRLFGSETADLVLDLSDDQFWRDNRPRELMGLLRRRWDDFPAKEQRLIGQRILDGPPRPDDEDEAGGETTAISRFGWLVQAGCAFPEDLVGQWKAMKGNLPGWDDNWIDDAVATPAAQGVGDVKTNEDTTVLDGLPIGEIVPMSLEHSGHTPFVVNEPFTGLVKTQPGRAIRALGAAARRGEFSAFLWSSALHHWPDDAPQRATRVLHGRMRQLPPATIVALRGKIGDWLADRFPDVATADRALAFGVFDHLVESLLAADSGEPESSRGKWPLDVSRVQASRPTYLRASNAPIGKAVRGLLQVLKRDNPEHGAGLPEDFRAQVDRLVSASGEGADDAVCVLSSRAARLIGIDPGWVDAKMVPCFDLDHDRAESAWNGILWNRAGIWLLFDEIKDSFRHLPDRMDEVFGKEMELYCECIVALAVASGADERRLSFEDARQCLRGITSEGREHVIWLLGPVGKKDDGWRELVIPFIRGAWPNEREHRTSGTSKMWLSLLCDTDDAFPDVLSAVRNHLGNVDWRQAMLPGGVEPLATRFPQETLDLLNRVVSDDEVAEAPYGLSQVLGLLVEAEPALIGDRRYDKLHRLAARQ